MKIIELCQAVLKFIDPSADPSVRINLSDSAVFICKIWDGPMRDTFAKEIRDMFGRVRIAKPNASREHSAEVYLYSKRS